MKVFAVAAAALLGFASAQQAVVVNQCGSAVYVQSVPQDGSAAGPLTTVQPGDSFAEDFRPSGSTVKIARTRTLTDPLFFGYSFASNPDYAYYELSTEWGNPFVEDRNTLSPGEGCDEFDCEAGDAGCYSTPGDTKVYGCPQPVELTATLCA